MTRSVPRWQDPLCTALKLGCVASSNTPCVFLEEKGASCLFVCLYWGCPLVVSLMLPKCLEEAWHILGSGPKIVSE